MANSATKAQVRTGGRRSTGVATPDRIPGGTERRAPEPLLFTPGQLTGRAPIRLRRRSDKFRLAGHLAAVAALLALTAWWVLPLHGFAGPVLLSLTSSHGVHAGDLPCLAFLALAGRSLFRAGRLVLVPTP
jgi:hypothetical protein